GEPRPLLRRVASRRRARQGALHRLPDSLHLPCRGASASGAVGRLGWRARHAGRRRAAQAAAWTSAQERDRRVSAGFRSTPQSTKAQLTNAQLRNTNTHLSGETAMLLLNESLALERQTDRRQRAVREERQRQVAVARRLAAARR